MCRALCLLALISNSAPRTCQVMNAFTIVLSNGLTPVCNISGPILGGQSDLAEKCQIWQNFHYLIGYLKRNVWPRVGAMVLMFTV